MNRYFVFQSSAVWFDLIDLQPGVNLEPHPVATISTRVPEAEQKIRELAHTLNSQEQKNRELAQKMGQGERAWLEARQVAEIRALKAAVTQREEEIVELKRQNRSLRISALL
jgi:hypothetical protein